MPANPTPATLPASPSPSVIADANHNYRQEANPDWLRKIGELRREGKQVFLLHFNVRDLVFDPEYPPATPADLLSIEQFCLEMMSHRDIVLSYSLHTGIHVHFDKSKSPKSISGRSSQNTKPSWDDIARDAAKEPYQLLPSSGMVGPETATPPQWRTPLLVFRQLTRILTDEDGRYNIAAEERGHPPHPISVGIVIDYMHHLTPHGTGMSNSDISELVETIQRWSIHPRLSEADHLVILLVPVLGDLHPELTSSDSRVAVVEIPWPNRDQRADLLTWLMNTSEDYAALRDSTILHEVANRTSGMNYTELRSFARTVNASSDWQKQLNERRTEIIRRESHGLLVRMKSEYGLNSVAGYQYIAEHFDQSILGKIRQGEFNYSGILFSGPPGTGKSFYARALARDVGIDVVQLRAVRGSYVGESERNFEQVLRVAQNLAPVIIFVDEIDQQFTNQRQAAGDSGVEQRLFGRLLEFMEEPQNLGKVIWIGASNRPDMLDPALQSRFKLQVPFLLPDFETCCALLKEQLPAQSKFCWQEGTWDKEIEYLIEQHVVSYYSGRELDTIIKTALAAAENDAEYPPQDAARQVPVVQQPIISTPNGLKAVHAHYLAKIIQESNAPHDTDAYEAWALLALRNAPRCSHTLVRAIQSTLPRYVDEILEGNRLNTKRIGQLADDLLGKTHQTRHR